VSEGPAPFTSGTGTDHAGVCPVAAPSTLHGTEGLRVRTKKLSLPENIVFVNPMMMTDVPEFSLVRPNKLKDHAICSVHSETPYFMMLGMQLFRTQGWVKRIALEQVGLGSSLMLDRFLKFVKQTIKGRGRRNFDHDRLFDQFPQGFSFGHSSRSMISLGSIKRVEKFPSIQTNRVTESFKIRLGDLNPKTLVCSLGNSGWKRLSH
jgi:hypothetical protein